MSVRDGSVREQIVHLAKLVDYAARNGCKLVLAGDQEQLAAVESGGAMTLLADRLGYVQLAEPSGSPPPGNAPPPSAFAKAMPMRSMSTTSTAASPASRLTMPWTRLSTPTSPATSLAGTSC